LRGLSVVYANLCACAANRGALVEAERCARQSVTLKEQMGDRFGLAQSLDTQGVVLSLRGERSAARECLRKSLLILQEIAAWRTLPIGLIHMAQLERDEAPERAARLAGAAYRLNRDDGIVFPPNVQADVQALESGLRTALGEAAFAAAFAAGEALDRSAAITLALSA
jgi:hypothetical protein